MPTESPANTVVVRHLGMQEYAPIWQAMQDFTHHRTAASADEIWLLQHPPIFTLGLAGKREHLLNPEDIPVIQVDRGGQVTYHGPGQIVGYLLIDLKRKNWGVRQLVHTTEQVIIDLLSSYHVTAIARADAPGVYIQARKIAALGFRVRRGCSFHGLSLNVAMDLEPFRQINPCGHVGLEVIDMQSIGLPHDLDQIEHDLMQQLLSQLGYHKIVETREMPDNIQ